MGLMAAALDVVGRTLWHISVQASVLIGLVALVALLARKAPPTFRYALWCIVLARLCVPLSLSLPVGLMDEVRTSGRWMARRVQQSAAATPVPVVATASAPAFELAGPSAAGSHRPAPAPPAPSPLGPAAILALTWLAFVLLGAGVVVGRARRVTRLLSALPGVARPELVALLETLRRRMGVSQPVTLRQADSIVGEVGPMTVGVFRPVVILPQAMASDWPVEDVEPVLVHELAHIRRLDLAVNCVQIAVQLLYFFHPLVWYANRRLRQEREMICDDLAAGHAPDDRRTYCRAVLRLVEETEGNLAFVGSGIGMAERHSSLGRRIMRIMDRRYGGHRRVGTLGIALVILVSAIGLTLASEKTSAGLDRRTREVGEEVNRRLTAWTDAETLVLADGQSAVMKVKPNRAGVGAVRLTVQVVPDGTEFDLVALDAAGQPMGSRKARTSAIHDGASERTEVPVSGSDVHCGIQLAPLRNDKQVTVQVKVLFFEPPTEQQMEAALLVKGKEGALQLAFRTIGRAVVAYRQDRGAFPARLDDLGMDLPADPYSPTGEPIRYAAERRRFVLGSCGNDGDWGTDDDEMLVASPGNSRSGQRHELLPLSPEAGEAQRETLGPSGERPNGSCRLAGHVVDERTGRPVAHATVYLWYGPERPPLFVSVAADGSFELENVACGEMSLQVVHTAGYQDLDYNPEGAPRPFPRFTLADKEQRLGIAFNLQAACRISGRVLAEDGQPVSGRAMEVIAWVPDAAPKESTISRQVAVRPDGTYLLDGLPARPLLVSVQDQRAELEDAPYPPRFYPGTFSREEAQRITFDEKTDRQGIDIRLARAGGLTLDGRVMSAITGAPIANALVVALYEKLGFDRVTTYTDAAGRFHMEGLGPGAFIVQADARPLGFVRTKKRLTLGPSSEGTSLDFELAAGVTIKGTLVDEANAPLAAAGERTFGWVVTERASFAEEAHASISMTGVRHRLEPANVAGDHVSYEIGEGDDRSGTMIFPTASTFLVSGAAPGTTRLGLKVPDREVRQISHKGRDVTTSGLVTTAGQTVEGVEIVLGPPGPAGK